MSETSPSRAPRVHLPALTAIRGVAALWVVIFHIRYELQRFFPEAFETLRPLIKSGYLGVDLFFVLSGFVIALNYLERFERFSWREYWSFMVKRFARIYPAYLVTLLFTVLVVGAYVHFDIHYKHMERFTLDGFIQSLTMTQALSFPIPRQWNLVAWSVSAEWLAYLAFPLVAAWALHMRNHTSRLTGLALVAVLYMLAIDHWNRPSAMELGLLRIAGAFTIGVLLCGLRDCLPTRVAASRLWGLIAVLGLLAIPVLYDISWKARVPSVLWAPLAFAPVIFALAQPGAQRGLWRSRTAIYLGHTSYAVYLVHGTLLMGLRGLLHSKALIHAGTAVQIGYIVTEIALILGAGHLLYKWVEEPGRRKLLDILLSKRKQKRAARISPRRAALSGGVGS